MQLFDWKWVNEQDSILGRTKSKRHEVRSMSHGVELIMETVGHIVIRPSPTHYFACVFLVTEHHMFHNPSILLITRCVF